VNVAVDESSVSTTVAGVGNSKILSVFVRFVRVLSDPRTDGNSVTVYFSESESFAFIVRQSAEGPSPSPPALDGSYILLADITRVFGGTTIVNSAIGISRREDCFVATGSPNSLRRGLVKTALADLTDWINTEVADRITAVGLVATDLTTHITNPTDAHDATAISYAGSGNWADATALVSTDVEAAIDEIVSSLADTVAGDLRIGSPNRLGLYLFSLTGGTVGAQLDEIQNLLDVGPRGRQVTGVAFGDSPIALGDSYRDLNVDTTGGAITVNLPDPGTHSGYRWRLKDSAGNWDSNNVSLVRFGAENIEGVAATRVLSAAWGSVEIYSDGTNWFLA
jgi:hypothetical protein